MKAFGSKTRRRALFALMALSLSSLAGALLASTGGFSSGSWGGSPAYNANYHFAIIDAHSGALDGSKCATNSNTNTAFEGGASNVNAPPADVVHAFWLLTGYRFAVEVCNYGFFIDSPYEWGQVQGEEFVYAVRHTATGDPGYQGPIWEMIGDVEPFAGALWYTQPGDLVSNIQVIKGFSDYVKAHHPTHSNEPNYVAVYTSPDAWTTITGGAPASAVTADYLWLAHYDLPPTPEGQTMLNNDVIIASAAGFTMFSWQYGRNTVENCEGPTYTQAQTMAGFAWANYNLLIPRFDVWTNSRPDLLCPAWVYPQ